MDQADQADQIRDGRRAVTRSQGRPLIASAADLDLDDLLAALARPWRLADELPLAALDAIPGYTRLQVQLLHNRGVRGEAAIHAWHARDWRAMDPGLPGLTQAVDRVRQAITRRERIVVFGDYDADGITSCAVLLLALRSLGADVSSYIPHREDAGRGPNEAAIRELRDRGADLLITTDNGTTNASEVGLAVALGMEVIVTDHHAPQGALAPAHVIVNPHLAVAPIPDADLAGVGVAFRLAEALLAATADGDERAESLLDLVALGTIADIAPLTAVNWALVRAGLRRLNAQPRPGLRALLARIGLTPGALHEGDIAYRIAPRLNAGQRMGEPRLPLDLLLTDDPAEADRLAARLAALNEARQRKTEELVDDARAQLLARPPAPDAPLVVAQGKGWPFGMLGLVAGKLAEEFKRPAVVISREGDICRGSVRSPDGVSVVEALGARAELLSHFGGHARAAGFTVAVANLEPLLAHLRAYMASASHGDRGPALDDVAVDCRLPLSRVGRETYLKIRELGPFGPGFPEPRFLARNARILRCFRAGPAQRHLRLVLRDGTAERVASWPNHGQYAPAIARHLSSLPPLDVIYGFDPFYVSSSADREYMSVVALTPAR